MTMSSLSPNHNIYCINNLKAVVPVRTSPSIFVKGILSLDNNVIEKSYKYLKTSVSQDEKKCTTSTTAKYYLEIK